MDSVGKYWSKGLLASSRFVCLGHNHYDLISIYVPRAIKALSAFIPQCSAFLPYTFWSSSLLFAAGQLLTWAGGGHISALELGSAEGPWSLNPDEAKLVDQHTVSCWSFLSCLWSGCFTVTPSRRAGTSGCPAGSLMHQMHFYLCCVMRKPPQMGETKGPRRDPSKTEHLMNKNVK